MANVRALTERGMVPELAGEVAAQIDAAGAAGVESVNGQTGAVTLDASDVGAMPDDTDAIVDANIDAAADIALSKLANVAAYPDGGISAGTLQATLNALADRITALEP